MNGQDHAREAEKVLNDPDRSSFDLEGAQIHATLAVAYAQASAWKDTPSPTAGSLSSEPCHTYGCVRAQGHDGNHVAANGIDWPDA